MKVKRFEDLEIWQLARELCKIVFKATENEPFKRDFKLKNQILGSSGSVIDNIAEGFERGGNNEFFQFLSIAKGSCGETRSQLYRAFDFGYIDQQVFDEILNQAEKVSSKISSMMNYLKKSDFKGPKYM
jgi:four helix bundle protein